MASSLDKRAAKGEQELTEILRQNAVERDCICARLTTVFSDEQLQAEESRKCPVHGERRDHFFNVEIGPTKPGSSAAEKEVRPPIRTGRYAETLQWKKKR